MRILNSSVGRKLLMSISGQLLIIFILIHLAGNSTIYFGWINAYAEHLHSLPPVVWAFRAAMLFVVGVHICYGVVLTLENKKANPTVYAVKRQLKASFAGENMIWTGLLIAAFVIYHLLQFTVKVTPDVAWTAGVAVVDVYKMVVTSFSNGLISVIYAAALLMLFLHLSHGIPSFLQTMGWNSEKTIPVFGTAGKVIAAVLMLAYVSIPAVILAGLLKL